MKFLSRKILLITILISLFNSSFSQEFLINKNNEINENGMIFDQKVEFKDFVINYNETGTMMYKFGWNNVKYGIEVFKSDRNSHQLIKKVELFNGKRFVGPFFTKLIKLNSNVFLIYHEVQNKHELGNIMAVQIDTATLEQIGVPKVIGNVGNINPKILFRDDLRVRLTCTIKSSPDHTKNMLVVIGPDKSQFCLSVFDNDCNILWNTYENLNTTNYLEFKGAAVDNIGNIYYSYFRLENPKLGYIRVVVYNKTKISDKVLPLTDVYVHELFMEQSKYSNKINIVGYGYSKSGKINCAFRASVNPSKDFDVAEVYKSDMPKLFIEQLKNDSWAETGKDTGISKSFTSRMYERENGSLDLVSEFERDEFVNKNVFHTFGTIITVNITQSNATYIRIPKNRVSTGSSVGSTYYAFPSKESLVILYNDLPENLEKAADEKVKKSNVYKNCVTIAATINADGTMNRKIINDDTNDDFLAILECAEKIDSNTFKIPVAKIKSLSGGVRDKFKWLNLSVK